MSCENNPGGFQPVSTICSEADLGECAHAERHVHHLERFERVITAMNNRLDQPMTNTRLADIACLSPCHFNRLFRNMVGIPPIQFHYALRLKAAKRLLME